MKKLQGIMKSIRKMITKQDHNVSVSYMCPVIIASPLAQRNFSFRIDL
jgi:hypothetical protein